MGVTENDTDLGWGGTLLCELADLIDDLLWGGLQPRRRSARVWDGARRDTLSTTVHTTHDCGIGRFVVLKLGKC